MSQSVSSAEQEFVKTKVRMASKEVVSQSVSSAEQEFVKTKVRMTSKEVVSQSVLRTTSSVTTTTTTMKESIQSRIKSLYDSATLEVVSDFLFERISTMYDILCEQKNMTKGKLFVKSIIYYFGSFVGSSLGTAIGRVVIPTPYVGDMVGSMVGGYVGSLMGNMIANAVLA